jgi:sugar phosphate isomerase/epimerase
MHKILSSHLFVNSRLTTVWLERIVHAGFDGVEIFCAKQHLDYSNRAQLSELADWFRDSNLQLWSVHSPMYTDEVWGRSGPQSIINIAEINKGKRIAKVDEIKRALEVSEHIPFRYLIQHLGVTREEFDEKKLDAAFSSLEELIVFAQQRKVEILIENTPNELSSADRLKYFNGLTHLNLNYCFDIGHAHMASGIAAEFESMKQRIRSTHIHDNGGSHDSHFFPMQDKGTIKWNEAMKLLGRHADQYPLVLELREVPGLERPIEKAKHIADQLEQLI